MNLNFHLPFSESAVIVGRCAHASAHVAANVSAEKCAFIDFIIHIGNIITFKVRFADFIMNCKRQFLPCLYTILKKL